MNRSIRNKRRFAALTGLAFLTASVSALAIYIGQEIMTPEFARAEYRPMSLVIIPPHAAVSKSAMFSSHQLIEQGGVVEDATAEACKDILSKLGYEVRVLTVEEVNADPDLQVMVRDVNKRFDEDFLQKITLPLKRQLQDVRERRFKMGDEARILADRLAADAIIVSRVEMAAASGGASVFSLGTGGDAEMNVGVIAGDNGDLEAVFTGAQIGLSAKKLEKNPAKTMAKIFGGVLKDYPKPDELVKVKKSWPQTTNREVPDAEISDEDVLSNMEAMFEQSEKDATHRLERCKVWVDPPENVWVAVSFKRNSAREAVLMPCIPWVILVLITILR